MEISKRLKCIANLVDRGLKVADIGTDHGLVPNYLVDNEISDYIVCSDISKNSLEKSISLIESKNRKEYIFPRVGNGLDVLKISEVDIIIIAGMGGTLISEIIENNFEIAKSAKKIILQPMQGQQILRKYLYNKGFEIVDEKIVFEDARYFEIIVVTYTNKKNNVDDIFYEIPKLLYDRKEKILVDFINDKIKYNENIINEINNANLSEKSKKRLIELKEKNKVYEDIICNIK